MDAPYRLETLPLDAPDEDPRWREYYAIFAAGFLGDHPSEEAVTTFRDGRRSDRATLDMVTAEGPGLSHRQPIAAFNSAPFTLNAGAGLVDALAVNSVAVRSSHRRRGLLTSMMTRALDRARHAELGCAVLTASEATIYGRYGFGPASRKQHLELDTRRFAIRPEVEVADGTVEFIEPADLRAQFDAITGAHQRRYRGAHGRQYIHREQASGTWDPDENGPSRKLRALLHFSSAGQADGFALFSFPGKGFDSGTAQVHEVCSPAPAVDRALWRALAGIDLVETLSYDLSHPADPLPLSLIDPRAVTSTGIGDGVWLRILDPGVALSQRGFDSDGSLVLGLADPLDWATGAWRLEVSGGRAAATPTDAEPDVRLHLATLGQLYFGDRTAENLAQSGLVTGTAEAIGRMGRLFAVGEPPVNLTRF